MTTAEGVLSGMKERFPGMDRFRKLWDEYVTRSACSHGLIPMLWDTGGILNRVTGEPKDRDLVTRLGMAVKTAAVKSH